MLSITEAITAVVEAWVDVNEMLVQSYLEKAVQESIGHIEFVAEAQDVCSKIVEDAFDGLISDAMYEVIAERI